MIKRRHAHLAFALTGAALLGALVWQTWQLRQTDHLATRLASVPDAMDTLNSGSVSGVSNTADSEDSADANGSPEMAVGFVADDDAEEHPAVQLAQGSALAKGGNLEAAERLLNRLISNTRDPETSIGAQYNLANLYLREALNSGNATSSKTLPMVELAKQRYRDLLQVTPEHWSARYNLERALQMAPEGTDRAGDERIDPVKSVNVIVPGFEKKDLP